MTAKGFIEPLAAYPVEGLTGRSVRRTIPFVGRTNELQILRDGFARVVSTNQPLLVTVMGESGIGKSRLCDEFLAGLGPQTRVLSGRGYGAADSATFAPAATMVRDAVAIDPDDSAEKTLLRLREFVDARPLAGGDAARVVDRLGLLMGLATERREQSAFVQDVRSGFLSLVEALGSQGPVVLLFEDLHGLRAPMVDLVERVAGRSRTGPGPVLVLTTARPEFTEQRPSWGGRAVNHLGLRLEPLGVDDASALARQASGGALDVAGATALAARAGGNPFFIVESTGAIMDAEGHTHVGVPPSVQAVVAARLDHLPPNHRDLARRLSVFLSSFDVEEAELVASCGIAELSDLEDAEIVVRDATPHGALPRWRMRHDTLHEVAYAGLPKRLRLELHLKIADALAADGHLTYAADHIERAAEAAIDLDPADRTLPDRAADALARPGTARGAVWRADRPSTTTSERSPWPAHATAGACARPMSWPGRARPGTGWANTPKRPRR